jgi:hypothetical protein
LGAPLIVAVNFVDAPGSSDTGLEGEIFTTLGTSDILTVVQLPGTSTLQALIVTSCALSIGVGAVYVAVVAGTPGGGVIVPTGGFGELMNHVALLTDVKTCCCFGPRVASVGLMLMGFMDADVMYPSFWPK